MKILNRQLVVFSLKSFSSFLHDDQCVISIADLITYYFLGVKVQT